MAVALTGAIITEQIKTQMKYKHKCEKCGWVETGHHSATIPNPKTIMHSSFSCQKCRNLQKVDIQG